jgi:transcriptional regulator with XRE-family HTH domain
MKFNEKLTVLRKERGMNMTEFAKLLGTSKQVINRYERGENTPKITTVAHYAEVLGVSLQYLINEDCTDRQRTTPTDKKTTPSDNLKLTEGEELLLNLFRQNRKHCTGFNGISVLFFSFMFSFAVFEQVCLHYLG